MHSNPDPYEPMTDVNPDALEYHAILEAAGIAIIFTRARQVTRCNQRAEQLFGWPEGSLVGQSGNVFYPDAQSYADIGAKAAATLGAGQILETDCVFVRRDGQRFSGHLVARAVDASRPEHGTVWIATDTTLEREKLEANQRLLREQQLIFERAQVGIMFSRDRRILRCNPCFEQIFGYNPGEMVGQLTLIYAQSGEVWSELGKRFYSDIAATGIYIGEDQYLRRDGRPIWCHVTGSMLNPNDPEEGYVWLYKDVTDRVEANAARDAVLHEQTLIFERVQTGILFVRNRTILRCNPRFEEIFGYHPGEMIGHSTRIYHHTDEDWAAAGVRAYGAIGNAGSYRGQESYCHRDGSTIWCEIVGCLIDPDHPEYGLVFMFDDVTQDRQASKALERANFEYALIFDNATVGISYMRNRVFLRCNRRSEEIFGCLPGTLVGQSSRVLFASDQAWEDVGKLLTEEANSRNNRFSGEIEYVHRDGTLIWVHLTGQRISDGDGDVWVYVYQDVTRQRLAEQALRQSHRELESKVLERTAALTRQVHLLRELIEAIPGPVFYKDEQLRYIGCNSAFAAFAGIPIEQLLGKTPHDVAPPELAAIYVAADQALLASRDKQIYESQARHADGSMHDVVFHKATFSLEDGSVGGVVGVMLDISERKRLQVRLQQAATVFDSTADGVTITAPDGTILAINRAFTEITGYSEAEVIGQNPRLLQSGRQGPEFYREMWDTIARNGRWKGELWNKRKDGSVFPEWLTITAVRDSAGNVIHHVGVFSDISVIKKAQERLDYQAHHDPLTGLPNRLLLEDRMRGALQRARRDQSSLALLFVDLDRFKAINDTFGHPVGDLVLCEVAQRFCALTRESDTVARLGGDEFLIILEGVDDPSAASRIADKMLDDLRANPVTIEQEFFIGASVGISLFPQDGDDAATLLKNADVAMYRAKERGRNTYEFFTNDLTIFSLERFQMETGLRRAIERDELRVYLQPQFSLISGELIGAEALVRWQHPQQGLMAPGLFIALAEESGLIVPMGQWVQRTACRQWAQWVADGLAPGVLSINVSAIEFRRGKILESLRGTLAATQLEPELLELEITESAIMSHAESSIQVLHDLRAMGLSLAIDDFGTGYSSLAYLKRLPLTKLKVDQSFVRGLPGDSEDGAITRAVIALGHSLQLRIIAEGVETEEQATFLTDAGCDEMQGYLRGRPVPFNEFFLLHLHR